MTEQLEALRKQQAELAAQIITLEDEARRAAEIKVGDYVQITKSNFNDGKFGVVVETSALSGVNPYSVKVIPYAYVVNVYEVRRVPADEIRTFLYESAASLS